jgi:hypothetical protein
MNKIDLRKDRKITPDMTVLDIIDRYRDTESVFRKYDEQVGVCICCQALFETIGDVAAKYELDLDHFLLDLEEAILL